MQSIKLEQNFRHLISIHRIKSPMFTPWCTILFESYDFLFTFYLIWPVLLHCYMIITTATSYANLLLWLLIAVGLSGLSYWLLRRPGVLLGRDSFTASQGLFCKVTYPVSRKYETHTCSHTTHHVHTQYTVLAVSWLTVTFHTWEWSWTLYTYIQIQ